jgi:hypothetical protein
LLGVDTAPLDGVGASCACFGGMVIVSDECCLRLMWSVLV